MDSEPQKQYPGATASDVAGWKQRTEQKKAEKEAKQSQQSQRGLCSEGTVDLPKHVVKKVPGSVVELTGIGAPGINMTGQRPKRPEDVGE